MDSTLEHILADSVQYYRSRKRELVARLLLNPKGVLKRRIINGSKYCYLKRGTPFGQQEAYLGPCGQSMQGRIAEALKQSRLLHEALKDAKEALKQLRVPPMERQQEDFTPALRAILTTFDTAGLWEEGLELIGSWCFKVYQAHCGVDFYPEATLDADFAIQIPYRGRRVDIPALLRPLGFEERINHADGTSLFVSSGLRVEFLKHRKGDGQARRQQDDEAAALNVRAQSIPYLNILLENPVTLPLRGIGKVTVPSPPAFFLHKLLVADERRGQDAAAKRMKDLRQVEAVGKALLRNPAQLEAVASIFGGLHKKWRQKILKSLAQGHDALPGGMPSANAVMTQVS